MSFHKAALCHSIDLEIDCRNTLRSLPQDGTAALQINSFWSWDLLHHQVFRRTHYYQHVQSSLTVIYKKNNIIIYEPTSDCMDSLQIRLPCSRPISLTLLKTAITIFIIKIAELITATCFCYRHWPGPQKSNQTTFHVITSLLGLSS